MILALLIFLPTLIFFPHVLYAFGIIYIPPKIKITSNLFIILLIVIFSLINQIIKFDNAIIYNKTFLSFFPYYLLIIFSYYISLSINDRTIKYIIIFVAFETIIAITEFFFNVPTFFPNAVSSQLPINFGYKGLLYYSRVFGLSNNSSELSFKIFAALLLLDTIKLNKYIKSILYLTLFFGIYITFNRSVILSLIVFYFISFMFYFNKIITNEISFTKFPISYLIFAFLAIFISIFIIFNFSQILFQFTRGMSFQSDSYKRNEIYNYFFDFILSHPFFGNGSFKLYYLFQNKFYHAHNSFIQIFATNGLLISILYLLLIFRNITKDNFRFIISFIVLSLTQYAIFWGISLLDIFLFYFLFNFKFKRNES